MISTVAHKAIKLLLASIFALSTVSGQVGVKHTFPVLSTTGPAASWLETVLASVGFPSRHAFQVTVTSLPATCTVKLEGSIDALNTPFDISTAQDCTAGLVIFETDKISRRVRPNVVTLTGTAATVSTPGCSNASPIVVTTSAAHGYSNGDFVTITGAVGNTACNVTNTAIAAVTSTTFELVGTTGNGAWTSGGAVLTVPTVLASYAGMR
jgi:hypothetical protein